MKPLNLRGSDFPASLPRWNEEALLLWKSFWAYYLSLDVSPLSLRALEMTRGCASVQSVVRVAPLTVLRRAPTLCLLALFPRRPTFDESFNLMLLRLYGFNFAISLAYNSQGFFSHVNSEPVRRRPKMASRFIGELFSFFAFEPKKEHYSAAITSAVDRAAARHDLRTSERQGVQWLSNTALLKMHNYSLRPWVLWQCHLGRAETAHRLSSGLSPGPSQTPQQ